MIENFQEEYAWLSNFYITPIIYNGIKYTSTEAAFQAQKCPERALEFVDLPPALAKKLGRQVPLRPDWEEVKDKVMYEVVYYKFKYNEDLKQKLLATGDEGIIEGNTWHDTYWGVCKGQGLNKLGKILMMIRTRLREESE